MWQELFIFSQKVAPAQLIIVKKADTLYFCDRAWQWLSKACDWNVMNLGKSFRSWTKPATHGHTSHQFCNVWPHFQQILQRMASLPTNSATHGLTSLQFCNAWSHFPPILQCMVSLQSNSATHGLTSLLFCNAWSHFPPIQQRMVSLPTNSATHGLTSHQFRNAWSHYIPSLGDTVPSPHQGRISHQVMKPIN